MRSDLPPTTPDRADLDEAPRYRPLRPGHERELALRTVRCHLHEWGDASLATADAPSLVLLHGWMDVGASFQFLVDELARLEGERRHVIAADWRGFGGSTGEGVDAYWFHDYLGDLDALLDLVAPSRTVDLVGHSMGGNVAMTYAGVRPARLRRLVNLEGFGLPDTRPEQSPDRLATWLDELKTPMTWRDYDGVQAVASRLRKNDPRLAADKARWLAPHWSAPRADGRWHSLGDPAHKRVNPVLYRREETLAAWRRIAAPVLWVEGADTDVAKFWGDRYPRVDFEARIAQVPRVERAVLPDCGHMLHHDQPALLARRVRAFLDAD